MKTDFNCCPECGSVLCRSDVPSCSNPDCRSLVPDRIFHWCSRDAMDIRIDEALLNQMIDCGLVLDVADLYRLRLDELLQFEAMDEKAAKGFLDSIAASKSRDWSRLLLGLSIPQVDAGMAQSLAHAFENLDELARAPLNQIAKMEGVSEIIARNLVGWFGDPQHRKLLKRLRQAGLNVE